MDRAGTLGLAATEAAVQGKIEWRTREAEVLNLLIGWAEREPAYGGRMDDQLKVGGVRLEPAEGDAALVGIDVQGLLEKAHQTASLHVADVMDDAPTRPPGASTLAPDPAPIPTPPPQAAPPRTTPPPAAAPPPPPKPPPMTITRPPPVPPRASAGQPKTISAWVLPSTATMRRRCSSSSTAGGMLRLG